MLRVLILWYINGDGPFCKYLQRGQTLMGSAFGSFSWEMLSGIKIIAFNLEKVRQRNRPYVSKGGAVW